jgi:hypothetical protein
VQLVVLGTQVPLQSWYPSLHVVPQTPLVHVATTVAELPPQTVAQVPQWFGSELKS